MAPNGHYSDNPAAFSSAGVSNPPLQALANSITPDGVYAYSSSSTFPNNTFNSSNYYVDVLFEPTTATAPGQVTNVSATAGPGSASLTWNAPSGGGAVTTYTITPYIGSTAQTATTVTGSPAPTSATVTGLTAGTSYTFTVQASNSAGSGPASEHSNAVTPTAVPDTIFGSATPATIDSGDPNSVELGVKFSSEVTGNVTGVRFYKAAANTGTHIGSLWSAGGTPLASATFTGESASGWQQVNFSSPVPISAGATYVASYLAPNGHYSDNPAAFSSAGVSNPPLQALANSITPDGVYAYSSSSTFPNNTFNSSNYYVDVLFEP